MNPVIKRRILIVDDVPANLLALRAVLEPLGAEIVQAASGPEAIKCITERRFDTVIMDVRMPGMDGFDTAEHMRSELQDGDTPIVFVTASDIAEVDVRRAYSHGHADLMPKPFIPEAMREKVRSFLQVAERHENEREQAGLQLMDAEERLQLALSAAQMVAWVWDHETDRVICSDGEVALFGRKVESVAEFMLDVSPEDRAKLHNHLEAAAAASSDLDVEFQIKPAGGSPRWIEAKGRLVNRPGRPARMFGVSMDVTARHTAQAQMQELNAALESARDKALYATHAKTVFLNAFGHELKTPLNGIINYAEMIEEELEGKNLDQAALDARKIRNLGAQLDHVVEQIFALADLDNRMGVDKIDNETPEIEARPGRR